MNPYLKISGACLAVAVILMALEAKGINAPARIWAIWDTVDQDTRRSASS